VRTIPQNTEIRAIYVTQECICYVDLTSKIADQHPGGIKSELLTVYSIVNSVVLNVPEVEAVKILINGSESTTLAGHIDLQVPVKANMLLIR
jgi:spore germination protein GerM